MKKSEKCKLKSGDIIVFPGMARSAIGAGIAVIYEIKKFSKSNCSASIRKIIEFGVGNVLDPELIKHGKPIQHVSLDRWRKLNFEDEEQRNFFFLKSKDIIINLFKYM